MRTPFFLSDHLREFLRLKKIATLPELKQALGTDVDITVFRKLKDLSYRSSYSHRGRYYTLDEIPQFDPQGLWSFQEVWFSRWGNRVTTLEALVSAAPQGYFAIELQQLLHVEVKDALLQLVQQHRLVRQQITGLFLYGSPVAALRQRQVLARQALSEIPGSASAKVSSEELKASLVLFASLLDERQRQLYAGLESMKLGRGGDQKLAQLLQVDPGTVARGRKQLLAQEVDRERVRKPGAGRKPVEKTPQVISQIERLLEHHTAGDPVSSQRWTHQTTTQVAEQLRRLDIRVGARTVARLLDKLGFSLRLNCKKIAAGNRSSRDQQFRHITRLRRRFCRHGNPIISVDAKKRELVGNPLCANMTETPPRPAITDLTGGGEDVTSWQTI